MRTAFVPLRGRDARGNLAACKRRAAPHDIWLHAENGPGAHVIIRRAHAGQEVPARTLDQAGSLAAGKVGRRRPAPASSTLKCATSSLLRRALRRHRVVDEVLASREVPVDPGLKPSFCRKPSARAFYHLKALTAKSLPSHFCGKGFKKIL